jgi:hypothetical protein
MDDRKKVILDLVTLEKYKQDEMKKAGISMWQPGQEAQTWAPWEAVPAPQNKTPQRPKAY